MRKDGGRRVRGADEGKEAECIYCTSTRSRPELRGEHVLAKGFGKFLNAPARLDCVCKDCNSHFSETLDLAITRQTFEGFLRYVTNVKPMAEVKNFLPGGIRLVVEEGPLKGARVHPVLTADGRSIGVGQVAQVEVLEKASGLREYYALDEVRSEEWLNRAKLGRPGLEVVLHSSSDEERDAIFAVLASKGIVQRGDLKDKEVESQVGRILRTSWEPVVTEEQRRAAAKFCFNFMASEYGSEFALESRFNDLRAYIRFGVTPPYELVRVRYRFPPDGGDTRSVRDIATHHSLRLRWVTPVNSLVGEVLLFGVAEYLVILSYRHGGVPRHEAEVRFDIRSMRACRILPAPRRPIKAQRGG
jgi:hypothetical protein